MKYIKYIAATLLLVASITACQSGAGVENGTPGQTTVQFAQAEVEEGFGAGVVYVPITIMADTEQAMNTCSVQAKVKVVTTGAANEGTHDTDGLSGDYRVTSFDMNFPAYDSYYDEKNPEKYKDPVTGKYVKTVNMEIFIVNDEPETLNFTLEIESATTTIGEQKQCKVVLVKGTRDRLCGNYVVTYDSRAWLDEELTADLAARGDFKTAQIVWNPKGYFQIFTDHFLTSGFGIGFYAYYDEEAEAMIFLPHEVLGYLDEAQTQWLFHSWWNYETNDWADDYVYTEFDEDKGVITFPENMAVTVSAFAVDADLNPVEHLGEYCPAYKGLVFTKVQ